MMHDIIHAVLKDLKEIVAILWFGRWLLPLVLILGKLPVGLCVSGTLPPASEVLTTSFDIGPAGCVSTTLRACSGHGTCKKKSGQCICDTGFSGAACATREYLFGCPRNCSFPTGGRCSHNDGQCICRNGWSGDDCAARAPVNCTAECYSSGHGRCVNGHCACLPGFYGVSCAQGCAGYDSMSGAVCSGHGVCVATGSPGHSPDRCKCFVGFAGDGCERDLEGVTTCPNGCTGHGKCVGGGRCQCDDRYAGSDCSIELRHHPLAHALDSTAARVGAVLAGLVLSSALASVAWRWVNSPGHETPPHSPSYDRNGKARPMWPLRGS